MIFFFSSDEDDVQPNIVVLKMQKPDTKGNGEFDDRIVREGLTQGNNHGTWEGKGLQKATHDSEIKGHTGKKVADKLATTGKARSQTLRAFATSRNVYFKDIIDFAPATSNSFFKNGGFIVLRWIVFLFLDILLFSRETFLCSTFISLSSFSK